MVLPFLDEIAGLEPICNWRKWLLFCRLYGIVYCTQKMGAIGICYDGSIILIQFAVKEIALKVGCFERMLSMER